jgi:hypothetical protein
MEFVNLENCVESVYFGETETRKRTLRKCNNYAHEHGRDDINYQFENGEVEIIFEFFDGYAIATDGSGLYMTYPTLDKVSKSKAMTERVEDYIGIYDDSISQHDIAMYYGVLKFSEGYFKAATPDDNDVEATTDEDKEDNLHETLIIVSSIIFDEVVEMTHDFAKAVEIVKDIAKRFEDYWDELMSDETNFNEFDYITELDWFIKERLAELHDTYDLKEEDFDEEPEDEEDDIPADEEEDEPKYKIAGFDEAMEAYADAMAAFNKIMGRV